MVVHVFALSLFSIKFISTRIADDPEDMYPYDYVYLANSQDGQYFERLERECQAKIYSFPMVRATTLDNTEMPNQFTDIVVQQGQNIGISESTYRELKELAGEPWRILHWTMREDRSMWCTSRIRRRRPSRWTGTCGRMNLMCISDRH